MNTSMAVAPTQAVEKSVSLREATLWSESAIRPESGGWRRNFIDFFLFHDRSAFGSINCTAAAAEQAVAALEDMVLLSLDRAIEQLHLETLTKKNSAAFRRKDWSPEAAAEAAKRIAFIKAGEKITAVTQRSALYHYQVPVRNLAPELEGATLLHLSDIHFKERKLKSVVEIEALSQELKLRGVRVAAVIISGDIITNGIEDLSSRALQALKGLAPEAKHFFTLGNHDFYGQAADGVKEKMASIGYQDLTNTSRSAQINGGTVNFFGVDDFLRGRPMVPRVLAEQDAATNILVVHNLDAVRASYPDSFDLILSGHFHSGEVQIGRFNGTQIMHWCGFGELVNGQFKSWEALTDRALSYVSPGYFRHWFHFNVDRRGGGLLTLTSAARAEITDRKIWT